MGKLEVQKFHLKLGRFEIFADGFYGARNLYVNMRDISKLKSDMGSIEKQMCDVMDQLVALWYNSHRVAIIVGSR